MYTADTSVKEIKGIGPKKAAVFSAMGINTLRDVILSYPRDYEDRSRIRLISELVDGETAMVRGTLLQVRKGRYIKGRKTATRLLVSDSSGRMELLFFNAGYLEKSLKPGKDYWFFGKASIKFGGVSMIHPSFGPDEGSSSETGILPVYPLVSGITQKERRRLAAIAVELADQIPDCFSEQYKKEKGLCSTAYALKSIHFPEDDRHRRVAKYRLIYEELLLFTLGLGLMKSSFSREAPGIIMSPHPYQDELTLPFQLTEDQARTVSEISSDMESGRRMSRLVQGDVGSGKTAVAAKAIFKAIKNGCQAALMAPTEILAEQHLESFSGFFQDYDISISLLTSATPAAERREILSALASGSTDLVIGTHALFSKDVEFRRLGLVVTDEQHRFGVAQREALSLKGEAPHILVMTATPIPRTMAMVLYADMDISIIKQKPSGRKDIITRVVTEATRQKAYGFVRQQLDKGRQVYIVTALIEDSEAIDAKSSEAVYAEACQLFAPYRAALLHGRMKQDEKDAIMTSFRDGDIQVLVSTVVIEVGINVPNATVMIIENSERFGLAQMHQLRGRVGRGSSQSYCFPVLYSDTEVAVERARIMESTSDGFEIAEKDLVLRGTGEFFGARQHGIPEMRIADIIRHTGILKAAADDARAIIEKDPLLKAEDHKLLKERISELYGNLRYNG